MWRRIIRFEVGQNINRPNPEGLGDIQQIVDKHLLFTSFNIDN